MTLKKEIKKPVDNKPGNSQKDRDELDKQDKLDKLQHVLSQRKERKQQEESDKPPQYPPVSLGPAGAVVDALLNTTPEKMLEFTDLDLNQVTLIPQVLVTDDMWDYLEQIALFRSNRTLFDATYKIKLPKTPNTASKFVLILAQCRRSLGGKTQKALEDLALADLETRNNNDEGMGGTLDDDGYNR